MAKYEYAIDAEVPVRVTLTVADLNVICDVLARSLTDDKDAKSALWQRQDLSKEMEEIRMEALASIRNCFDYRLSALIDA